MKQGVLTLAFLMALGSTALFAQATPTGIWKTIDDETGEAKSHIEMYQKDGQYYGKIVKLLLSPQDKTCDACPGKRKDKRLVGMVIVEDLKPNKDYWQNGNILDPETGKEYGCTVWLEDGKPDELKVRGSHWTGLYRTQTWYRVK